MRREMARWALVTALATAPILALSGCSSDDEASDTAEVTEETTAEATEETAAEGEADAAAPSDDLCVALESLEDSLMLIGDPDSVGEFDALVADVEAAYAQVQEVSGGEYADELDAFEQALNDFGTTLETEGIDPGALVDASGDLVEAGATLSAEVDCPTV